MAGHLSLHSKFCECGVNTNIFVYPFELLKLWESGIFERLGAKVIQLWNTEGKITDYRLWL